MSKYTQPEQSTADNKHAGFEANPDNTSLYTFDQSSQTDWQAITKQDQKSLDPTCGGVLNNLTIDFDQYSPDHLIPVPQIGAARELIKAGSLEAFGDSKPGDSKPADSKPGSIPEKTESGFLKAAADRLLDEALKKTVESLVKDFGSPDFKTREKAEAAAKKLGVKALPYLQEGLKSESPEVQQRTERAIGTIKRTHVDKCLEPVKALNKDFTKLVTDLGELTPEMRKKFEEKIKMADDLKLSQEDLDLAAEMYKKPDVNDADFFERFKDQSNLKTAHEMKAETRLWYAEKLAGTKDPEDKQKAIELMKEAIKLKGGEKCPGLVVGAVDKMGGVDGMPKEIQEAYKAAKAQILQNEAELEKYKNPFKFGPLGK